MGMSRAMEPTAADAAGRRAAVAVAAAHRAAAVLLAVLPSLAQAKPVVETLGELTVDFSAGTIEVRAAAAPDLRAPSAEVGRFSAERRARAVAAKRLREGLAKLPRERLGCDDAGALKVDQAIDKAAVSAIDWGSDGSVTLALRVSLAELASPATPATGSAILLDGATRTALFTGEKCSAAVAAPPVFESAADARATLPALKDAHVTRRIADTARPAAIVRSGK